MCDKENILSSLNPQIQYLNHEFIANPVVFRTKMRFITAISHTVGRSKQNTIEGSTIYLFQFLK